MFFYQFNILKKNCRDWSPKFATGIKWLNRHRSKSIWVTILSFCQNDSLMGESLWQKDRMVTHILFDLCLFKHFSPVANFGYQSLPIDQARRPSAMAENRQFMNFFTIRYLLLISRREKFYILQSVEFSWNNKKCMLCRKIQAWSRDW